MYPEITTLNQYQELAQKTAPHDMGLKFKSRHGSLGLISETGELFSDVKAHIAYGKKLDLDNIKKELGDIMWFVVEKFSGLGQAIKIGDDFNQVIIGLPLQLDFNDIEKIDSFIEEQLKIGRRHGFVNSLFSSIENSLFSGFDDYEGDDLIMFLEGICYATSTAILSSDDEVKEPLVATTLLVGIIANHLGFTLKKVLEANIKKLMDRYPKGFFTAEQALARNDESI